jgi:hypothetical protein
VSDVFSGFPKSLRIGPYDIPVKITDIKAEEGRVLFGTYSALGSIELNPIAPNPIHAADTVLHEILHGVYGNSGLGPISEEEQICSALSTGLLQVLRDNPKLVAWLTKALRAKNS